MGAYRMCCARLASRGTTVARDEGGTPSRPSRDPKKSWVTLLERQGRPVEDQAAEYLAHQHEQDRDVEDAGRSHRLRDLQRAVDHPAEAERGEGAQDEAEREEEAVLLPEHRDRRAGDPRA